MIRYIILILNFLYVFSFAQGKDIKVCPACGISSVKKAISIARPSDHVIVHQGVYKEGNIVIDKPLTLEGKNFPVLDGEGKTEIITIKSDHVKIRGFRIQNVGTSFMEDRAGIKVVSSEHCIIENNQLINTFFGIYLGHSQKCIVRNNEIRGEAVRETTSGNAIHLWYCDSVLVLNNLVTGHRDGIYFEFVSNSLIRSNQSVHNLRYGLHFMFSDHDRYINNTFKDNGAGVAVMYSEYILMKSNRFLNNWGHASYGLLLKDITDGKILYNEFRNNTIGIFAEGANRNQFKRNTLKDNGWAVKIMGNCEKNLFTKNNFISNTFEITTNTTAHNFNEFTGNYWAKYNGYDLNRDGIGDIPYRPVKLFSYLVEQIPPSIVLLRSTFVDLLNLMEKVTPVLTPETLVDKKPLMKKVS